MVLRKVFQWLKIAQMELSKIRVPKGDRKAQRAVEIIMDAQLKIIDLIKSGFDFKDENPRQLNFKWEF